MEDYKEKLKEALNSDNTDYEVVRWIEQNFPELKESEDEKIRKEIARFIQMEVEDEIVGNKWLAWLEKKGEQNPAWSEEDEIAFEDALWCCKQAASIAKDENDMGNLWYAERWLKSLKDRVQPKQEWSEEDEKMLNDAISAIGIADYYTYDDKQEIENWLKSLKERYTWKPSDEQIRRLEYFLKLWGKTEDTENTKVFETVKSLLNDLKKLREE